MVLAGGEGLKLRRFPLTAPEAKILVAGKPLLELIPDSLRNNGIKRDVLGAAYEREKAANNFHDEVIWDAQVVSYS